jgi:hypothetical protein
MDDGRDKEEYIHQVLEAYRKTPGTIGTVRPPTGSWPRNSSNVASL